MTARRLAHPSAPASVFALLGLLAFASMATAWRERPRDTSRPALANGRVVDVARDVDGATAVIEYEPAPGARVRFTTRDTEMYRVGTVGDVVLVAYDAARPREAVVWSLRPLWRALVRRAAAGALCWLAACICAWRAWRGQRVATPAPDADA